MRYQFLVDTPLLPLSRVEYINTYIFLLARESEWERYKRGSTLAVEIVLNNEFCCVLSWSSAITVLLLVCEIYTTNIFIAARLIDCRIFVLKDLHLLITQSTKISMCVHHENIFFLVVISFDGTFLYFFFFSIINRKITWINLTNSRILFFLDDTFDSISI